MDDFEILPRELKSRSLSDKEVVLSRADALKAIDCFEKAGWAILGYEGWIKYPDGRKGHSKDYQGTGCFLKDAKETWDAFVKRSANICRTVMEEDEHSWDAKPEAESGALYFCLTATNEENYRD